MIIEVADSSPGYDRSVTVPTYARVGIPEVWVADLTGDAIEAHSEPVHGTYRKVRRVHRGEFLTPERLPGIRLGVDEILG